MTSMEFSLTPTPLFQCVTLWVPIVWFIMIEADFITPKF